MFDTLQEKLEGTFAGLRSKGYVEVTPVKGELSEARQVVASGVGALILYSGARIEARPFISNFRTAATP